VLPLCAVLTIVITGLISRIFGIKHSWLKQLISWIVGAIFTLITCEYQLILLGYPAWQAAVCLCVVVGLVSNGIYDIPIISCGLNRE
jgi:hypothetical protein